MRLILACCLIFFSALAALASEDDSAKDFLKKCDLPNLQDLRASSNYGYCLGQIGTFMAIGPYLSQELRFCPSAAIPAMGIGILARYLREHPEQQEQKSMSAMVLAYRKEWPCK